VCFEQSCRPFLENGSGPGEFLKGLLDFFYFKPEKTMFSRKKREENIK